MTSAIWIVSLFASPSSLFQQASTHPTHSTALIERVEIATTTRRGLLGRRTLFIQLGVEVVALDRSGYVVAVPKREG